MSNDSSNHEMLVQSSNLEVKSKISNVPWNPLWAVVFIIVLFYFSQYLGVIVVSLYPWINHWSAVQANDWYSNSIFAQFIYLLIVESVMLGSIYIFLKKFKSNFSLIGLKKPRWSDLGLGILVMPLYYALFAGAIFIVSRIFHGFDVNQTQNIGFSGAHNLAQLSVTFISLVVLAPLVEEIMVRGFLYSTFRKIIPKVAAVLVTSLIFAAAHLPEGGASGPLYIAALDTFILSLVLIQLRERTGSLWASITLHGIKNGIAFLALFILNVH